MICWMYPPYLRTHIQEEVPREGTRTRFNRTVRYEWLLQYLWANPDEVCQFATHWMYDYNHHCPHMALGGFTPKQRLAMAA